jgi:hypothetical protein
MQRWKRAWLIVGLGLLLAAAAPPPFTAYGPSTATPLNCSGTIASGGTAQLMLAASTNRHFYQVQNRSADMLAFSEFTTSASVLAPTVALNGVGWALTPQGTTATAGGSFSGPINYDPTGAVWIVGATTGDAYSCTAW